MASSNNLETLNQEQPDEIAIDYSKLDLIKQEQDQIYRIFSVSIIFGDKVRPTQTSPINQMTQWLTLIGKKEDRNDARVSDLLICFKI